jgi:hypothetical protein
VIILNRKDMVSSADRAAWDKHFAAEATQAAKQQEAAQQRSAARVAARAAAAAEAGGPQISQQQQQQQQQQQDVGQQPEQQQEQELELQPPSMPQQVFWTDGKTGEWQGQQTRQAALFSHGGRASRPAAGSWQKPIVSLLR